MFCQTGLLNVFFFKKIQIKFKQFFSHFCRLAVTQPNCFSNRLKWIIKKNRLKRVIRLETVHHNLRVSSFCTVSLSIPDPLLASPLIYCSTKVGFYLIDNLICHACKTAMFKCWISTILLIGIVSVGLCFVPLSQLWCHVSGENYNGFKLHHVISGLII